MSGIAGTVGRGGGDVRVVISAAGLAIPRMTGIERYSIGLLRALRDAEPSDVHLSYLLPRWLSEELSVAGTCPPFRASRPLLNEVWLPWQLARARPNVHHSLAFGQPLIGTTPWVATIYDEIPWRLPERLGRAGRWYFKPSMDAGLRSRRLEAILTLSSQAAAALSDLTRPEVPVVVVPPGLEVFWSPGKRPPNGPPWRLLTVGTIEPRKGLDVLAEIAGALQCKGLEAEIRVVGRRGWGELPRGVRGLGVLTDEQLRDEYRSAHVLLAPSEAEGFDLPVLEALACGTPVIASDIAPHREHFVDAVRLIASRDGAHWADEIQRLLLAPDDLEQLRASGLAVAARFSWPRIADRVLDVYRAVGGRPTPPVSDRLSPLRS